ncbi:4-hydroxyphenylpyruvate dioxygenase [Couchioplanes azureus]|uniref:4-hydroxyphenylpyruvate dioxygenase n=1 Tax=Couchioplanes caeruleus TaxID=56438 RepID=UPI001670CB00|nr:4-hydroxyphenylpyruvate dioxygenase [Couchioplanes caeruleus]GGQ87551.1 4-hydroxyphenylpyruvate dioxygenase [Couchioplanes caeruleus subsp. azureus]
MNAISVNHIELYAPDAAAQAAELTDHYGFTPRGTQESPDHRSIVLDQGEIVVVVTEGRTAGHPATGYVERHGAGVGDIALRTGDAAAAYAHAVAAGARPVAPPRSQDGWVTARIGAFGDVLHTYVQPPAREDGRRLPGFGPWGSHAGAAGHLSAVDHFAVCLEAGRLAPTVRFYESLGFAAIFEERIAVGEQAMNSTAVQSASGGVTFTLIEPDPAATPGQIDEFLAHHQGPGVQHVAFATGDIVAAVGALGARGVSFLDPPAAYYQLLTSRLEPLAHTLPELRERGILADEDHDGQLYQIFTSSTHPRRTLFFEVIERLRAQTFGSGNVKALYEAVELERSGALSRP